MTRKPAVRRCVRSPLRLLALSAAISAALIGAPAQADPNPFARRGIDPAAQAARSVQQQGLQSVRAQQTAQKSLAAFTRASQVRGVLDAAQAAARAAAQTGNEVPNGLVQDGLKIAAGVKIEPGAILANDPRLGQSKLWLGAKAPTQRNDAGDVTVTIEQTQKKAILSWESFNVGKRTTVHFDQRAGNQANGNDWIALNRVDDPSGRPSQIFGRIRAEGSVYLLNRNGVLFGAGAQVNTRSLIASSLNLFDNDVAKSNRVFIAEGVRRANAGTLDATVLTSGLADVQSGSSAPPPARPGDIRIEAGATIQTASGGYSLIAAPNVANAGSVLAQDGQAQLAAVLGARAPTGAAGADNRLSLNYGLIGAAVSLDPQASGYGRLDNSGIVASTRGDVTLTGHDIRQDGYVATTTSISRPGTLSILAINHGQTSAMDSTSQLADNPGGSLTFGSQSVTAILPERDGETTTSAHSADQAFRPPSATLAGAQMRFQENSLVLMPGAKLDVVGLDVLRRGAIQAPRAPSRILIERGATISVAGLADVQRPMSDHLVTIKRIGENELADSPLLRGGGLFKQEVQIDVRERGITDDGRAWVGSPLLNASGYADQRPRTVEQMLVDGGSINISGREFIARSGSTLDLDAGYVHYLGGMIETRRLLGADGRTYRLAEADPNLAYVGFAGSHTLDHQRWGVKEVFSSPLFARDRRYESDYLEGGDAGQLSIHLRADSATQPIDSALILAGEVHAGAESGRYQLDGDDSARGGAFKLSSDGVREFTAWRWQNGAVADVGDGFGMTTPFASLAVAAPDARGVRSTALSAEQFKRAGFADIAINDSQALIEVGEGVQLQAQAGGRVALAGRRVEVDGTIETVSGEIALEAGGRSAFDPPAQRGDIVLGADARLLARGEWVNDHGRRGEPERGGAYIDGGKISLITEQLLGGDERGRFDASGSILIDRGAVLDVSSGGRILGNGRLAEKDGVALGRGGDISLQTYRRRDSDTLNAFFPAAFQPAADGAGRLSFEAGSLVAHNLGGGGTLRLAARDIRIGGDAPADPRSLHLAADFFADGEFGAYDLRSELDAVIVADTQVRVSQRQFLPDAGALRSLASGADLYAGGLGGFGRFGRLDDYRRAPTDFSIEAGGAVGYTSYALPLSQLPDEMRLERGAQLSLDPGADVRLGSRGQVSVFGQVVAHGGRIAVSGDTASGLSPSLANSGRGYWATDKSVWLGAEAVLDVSGTALIDGAQTPRTDGSLPRTGRLLDGGGITLSNNGGYVVVEQGARLELSGAAERFDVRGDVAVPGADPYVDTPVWSDAGRLRIGALGLYFDGDIQAHGGGEQARGGQLELQPLDGQRLAAGGGTDRLATREIVLRGSGSLLPEGARAGAAIEAGLARPSGRMVFAADRLDGSGIDTLSIGQPGQRSYVPVVFEGNVDLKLDRALAMNASGYGFRADPKAAAGSAAQVNLSAAYVAFNGLVNGAALAAALPDPVAPGDAVLSVQAGFIDFGGRVRIDNFASAQFDSRGDIRFHTPNDFRTVNGADGLRTVAGELLSGGDLFFRAAQLYPSTGERFVVRALGALDRIGGRRVETEIKIAGNGAASTAPLSAGGELLFDASRIEQGGTVRAPGGRIVLGAADPNDADTQALFKGLKLTPTAQVELSAGSLTSVSLEGRVVPYGSTVDGVQWKADALATDVSAPPQKQVLLDATSLALREGATVDLSGGGDLQAVEWVPGTGGSRDVLSRYGTSYADGGARQVPLYSDAREVYAIVPGVQSPLAAADPGFSAGDGSGAIGRAVYLSGVPGLADGVYTLLPGKYATLPGAFRVVQRSGALDSLGSRNLTANDGTHVVAGHYVDTLTGARDARSSSFEVQSAATWGGYSQYALTRADKYFSERAARNGAVAPQLPHDGGQLVLSATRSLELGASLQAAAAPGGAAAQIDIAAQAIQIRGQDQAAREGYVQLDVQGLNRLGAGSLLIGGTRSQRDEGLLIDARADSVVLDNDAASALKGAEIVLVARGGDGSDSARTGVRIGAGATIQADGVLPGHSDKPLLIGEVAGEGRPGVSGDGALLRVSNAGPLDVRRRNLPALERSHGLLTVGAGARVDGGASLTLDASGNTRVDPSALLGGRDVQANSGLIAFADGDASGLDGFVVGRNTLTLFDAAERIGLRSYGRMEFHGDVSIDVGRELVLSAAHFVGDGGDVRLRADTLTLANDLAAPVAAKNGGSGRLSLSGRDVVFGGGDKSLGGFAEVQVDAAGAIGVRGKGSLDAGAAAVSLRAPVIRAEANAEGRIATGGDLSLQRGAGIAPGERPQGGAIELAGRSIVGDALVQANSGRVALRADGGDVRLAAGAVIDVSAQAKTLYDSTLLPPAGQIELHSQHGSVHLAPGSALDFSAPAGGDAGRLRASAGEGAIDLQGVLRGGTPKGRGGSLELDAGQALDLDSLAARLAASGIDQRIAVRTRSGALSLSEGHSLKAREVSLIADGGEHSAGRDAEHGRVRIDGRIDASGELGGRIELWGRHGVEVDGQLIATGSDAKRRGGEIRIGTSGRGDGSLNAEFGYQNVNPDEAGTIRVGRGAVLDVSGGSAGGLSGGRVDLRAPLLSDGDVNVAIEDGGVIRGAREVALEAYAVWSTADASSEERLHFDGIIDPAGWYDAQGRLLDGAWTDAAGNPLAAPQTPEQTAEYLARHYFTPAAANDAHRSFYGYRNGDAQTHEAGTLMGFVQRPGFDFGDRFAGVANFRARPGIELRNPDAAHNGGAIKVLTNWNLNSGELGRFDFRHDGAAPVLTLRALGDVEVDGSISDGFFKLDSGSTGLTGSHAQSLQRYQSAREQILGRDPQETSFIYDLGDFTRALQPASEGDPDQIGQYYGQYDQMLEFLTANDAQLSEAFGTNTSLLDALFFISSLGGTDQPEAPVPQGGPVGYLDYLAAYRNYIADIVINGSSLPAIDASQLAWLPQVGPMIPSAPPSDRTPNLQADKDNTIPFARRMLAGGDSSSYRFVAGADFASAAPNALNASAASGSIVFDGHTTHGQGSARELAVPNVLRTGTGRIDLVAAQDIRFADRAAPASIYAAGRPGEGTSAAPTWRIDAAGSGASIAATGLIVTGQVNPEAAGDIVLQAGRDIVGNRRIFDDERGSRSGIAGNYLGQYWWPWLQAGNTLAPDNRTTLASSINFGGFAQGVLSVGGNVAVSAGRDVRELSVSLPTTWAADGSGGTRNFGGGDLRVDAGRDVLGGDYFVARGEGRMSAGGRIGSAFDLRMPVYIDSVTADTTMMSSPVAPILAMQDASWNVVGAQDVDIGRVLNPSYLRPGVSGGVDSQSFGSDASLAVFSIAGRLDFDSLLLGDALFAYGGNRIEARPQSPYDVSQTPFFARVLPARVSLTAAAGDVVLHSGEQLFPSARGQLDLIAGGDLRLYSDLFLGAMTLRMLDFDPAWMPSPLNQITKIAGEGLGPIGFGNLSFGVDRTQLGNLHRDDAEPVRLYAGGDILGGLQRDGASLNPLRIELPKPAAIQAGRDIVDLDFRGQNFRGSDTTRIVAGRDLFNRPLNPRHRTGAYRSASSWLELAGPGSFEVQAGRNLGRITSANEAFDNGSYDANGGGIRSTGNRNNAGLPFEGADVVVRFGVAPGIDTIAFAGHYLDPASADAGAYTDWLVAFMQQIQDDQRQRSGDDAPSAPLNAQQAWLAFQQQAAAVKQRLVDRVFLDLLKRAGKDNKDPASAQFGKYAAGYRAINTLFPASLGYTANQLEGGQNGAQAPVATGQLDMRGSTIQTQQGGDIRILGPGGDIRVGSASAPPTVIDAQGVVRVGPNQQGILTLDIGDIDIFTDGSVLLAQSRIFTQRGGEMLIWSSNGDINAGKGAKTSSDKPPVRYSCDIDHNCRIDAKGLVSGAGIATLQTVAGAKAGDAVLVAPRGTIDAGDAGIRISGNLILAAQTIANADNIQVDGDSLGIPVARGVDTGALAAASSAASGVDAAAEGMAEQRPTLATRDIPAVISVQVIGFGSCAADDTRCVNSP
ncbi:filamentous haemagglutinin family protein [Lysobacter sp. Hz 25]|uniref:filamentous haemagglutinin family protein n=1 Tax=Lysobacter sp. Hz 25 TaxID=3383698 RepID=UPI0038D4F5DB